MKAGIQISSLKPLLTTEAEVFEAFSKLSEMGYKYAQLQWIAPSVAPSAVARALTESGLIAVGIQDIFATVRSDLSYYLELCSQCHCPTFTVGRIPEEYKTIDGLKQYAGMLRELSETLKPLGVRLLFHGIKGDLLPISGIDPLEFLLENVPNLAFCLDLFHIEAAGRSLGETLRHFSGAVEMVHFKDYKLLPNGDKYLVPPGQGVIDWTDAIRACLETGVEYGFIEQESWEGSPFELMKQGLDWLQPQL